MAHKVANNKETLKMELTLTWAFLAIMVIALIFCFGLVIFDTIRDRRR